MTFNKKEEECDCACNSLPGISYNLENWEAHDNIIDAIRYKLCSIYLRTGWMNIEKTVIPNFCHFTSCASTPLSLERSQHKCWNYQHVWEEYSLLFWEQLNSGSKFYFLLKGNLQLIVLTKKLLILIVKQTVPS